MISYDVPFGLLALIISIISLVSVWRGLSKQAHDKAIDSVGQQMADLESEKLNLQKNLNRCFGERISLKEEIMMLKKKLEGYDHQERPD